MEMIIYGFTTMIGISHEHVEDDLELQWRVGSIGNDGKQNINFTTDMFMLSAKTVDLVDKKKLHRTNYYLVP